MTQIHSSKSQWMTSEEIAQQPDVWRGFAPELARRAGEIRQWLSERGHDEIWFCGAGTSAFVGETLASYLNRANGPARFRAIPTTDFVANPRAYIRPGVRVLVVSFGRSGNSSETVGMLDTLDKHAPQIDRLNITCNATSRLAQTDNPGPGQWQTIVLPTQTNDRGFAMTSSYTTMLLSALACFDPTANGKTDQILGDLASAAERLITQGKEIVSRIAPPQRAVFLGSGPLTGSARESALKVLELAAGRIVTAWDSTLGFRHGPKAVVDDKTLVFVYESPEPFTARYDRDLADEIGRQFSPEAVLRVGPGEASDIHVPFVHNDAWSSVLYVILAQMLSVEWSEKLGFNVDDPFAGRNLTRVVAGVKLYDLPAASTKLFGALDVGGTKIEAALFDHRLEPLAKQRIDTAKHSYDAFLEAIEGQIAWLRDQAKGEATVGICVPGVVDPISGSFFTANLPASGKNLTADLAERVGLKIPVQNDCKCLALSEANGGVGDGYRTVFGLVLGTGVGGGVCVNGKLLTGRNGLPGEVGHFALPAHLVEKYKLPIIRCGCGRMGCYETLIAGPGLPRLAKHVADKELPADEIAAAAASGDADMGKVMEIWFDLASELIHTIQLTIDPDVIALGGGLSRIPDIAPMLAAAFESPKLPGMRSPQILVAKYGDASGARGAALLAAGAI